MTRIVALSCPLCGGAVAQPADSRQVQCPYCRKRLHYQGADFTPRLFLQPALGDGELQRRFFEMMGSPLLPRMIRRRSVILHRRRLFFPLYVVSGTRGGILDTVREKIVEDRLRDADQLGGMRVSRFPGAAAFESSRIKVETTPDTRVVLGDFSYLYSAAAAEEWDLDSGALQEVAKGRLDEARAADLQGLAKLGEVLEATIPVERVMEWGVASGRSVAGANVGLLETTVRILYVPLVEIVFRYGDQVHRVLFEEMEGKPLAGRLPFGREGVMTMGLPALAALGLLLGKAARSIAYDPIWRTGSAKDAFVLWSWYGVFVIFLLAMGLQFLHALLFSPMEVEVMTGGAQRVAVPRGVPDTAGGALVRLLADFSGYLKRRNSP